MKLTLVRHAKSSWDNPALIDYLRPLSERGMRDAPLMAEWLGRSGTVPSLWLTSPATRARATAAIFAKSCGVAPHRLREDARIYLADPADWLQVIAGIPAGCRHAIAFGHNPGIQDLVGQLTGIRLKKVPTCAILQLRLRNPRASGRLKAELLRFASPKSIPEH